MTDVKESGFGRVDLQFDDYQEANRCLRDKGAGGGVEKKILILLFQIGQKDVRR